MKLKFTIAFIILLSWSILKGFPQQAKLDGLIKANSDYTKEDNKKLHLLNQLTLVYNSMQFDSARIYADKTIALAQKLNNQEELGTAYNNLANLLIIESKFNEAIETSNKAVAINSRIKNTRNLGDGYINLGTANMSAGKDSASLACFNLALKIFTDLDDKVGIGKSNIGMAFRYRHVNFDLAKKYTDKAIEAFTIANESGLKANALAVKGSLFGALSQYDSSFNYFNQALEIGLKDKNTFVACGTYGAFAYSYSSLGNYRKAIENFLLLLRYAEKLGSQTYVISALNNLAFCYHSVGDYTNALICLDKQLPLSLKLKDLYTLSACYQEFGNVYIKQKKYKEALEQYRLAYKTSVEFNKPDRLAECYGMLGDAFEGLMQYDSAFYYFNKAVELNKIIGSEHDYAINLISIARTLKNIPNLYIRGEIKILLNTSGKNKQAIDYASEAFQLVQKTGELDLLRNAAQILSELYEHENNFSKSFGYYKEYVSYKDSILNTENSKSIANMQIQYEAEKKEQEIILLSKEKSLRKIEIEKQKTTRNSFIGGIIIVLLITGVIYNRYRVKQKANKLISKTLLELKNTQQQLIEQEKLAVLGKLTSDTAQEIESPLTYVNNFASLNTELFQKLSLEQNEEVLNGLLDNLKINLLRINECGKNADAVVKKVLMTARSVSNKL
jgi:two-component system NtrC family sensor kinase